MQAADSARATAGAGDYTGVDAEHPVMRSTAERLLFLVRRDHTLGNVMERLAAIHGNRRLVDRGRTAVST